MSMKVSLSESQRTLLECAREWTDGTHDTVGVCIRGAAQHRTIGSLARMGLVEYQSHGRDVTSDGDDPGTELPIYAITPAGRAALTAARKETP